MRGHAYSAEEFFDEFDEEEREEYFRPGGRYDVQCETCGGKNVILVVDEDDVPDHLKAQYDEYVASANDEACDRMTAMQERMMGC
jgi:hypothetical protein